MKTAPANVMSASEPAVPDLKRMTKTNAVFRKLSLNAAKNWHQNNGAKRLDNIRGVGMSLHYCKVPALSRQGPHKKRAAFRPPVFVSDEPKSGSDLFLVGLEHHGAECETKRDADSDGEKRNPHNLPPTLTAASAGGVWR